MVVLNRIYTRTGGAGTTALGTGERRKKYDLRISAYGTLAEVNAVSGLTRLATTRAAQVLHSAGRMSGRGASPSRAHRLPAGRAADGRAQGSARRGGHAGGAQIRQ